MQSNILKHGSLSHLVQPVVLNAGELTMLYEGGFIRYIKWGDVEIVRMINHAVRDQNWGTVNMIISNEIIRSDKNSFLIEYEAKCQQGDVDFRWNCTIQGTADSRIQFNIKGKAFNSFHRNRIGFTVLHPIESCTGKDCIITHSNNAKEVCQFPKFVSPSQPFLDVAKMEWTLNDNINAKLFFEGDIFETEDQRNWIDASYKTYCTPLNKPFPVKVKLDDEISQTIQLVVGGTSQPTHIKDRPLSFSLNRSKKIRFPKIGITLSRLTHDNHTTSLIKKLGIDFLRIELNVNDTIDISVLQNASIVISEIGCSLEVVLFVETEFNVDFVQHLLPYSHIITQFIILPKNTKCTDKHLIDTIVPLLRNYFPHCLIGAGTDAFFAELNRSRTPTSEIDFLSFSANPQVHASDLLSLTETLKAHQYVVESCREFANGKRIHVGPVTFKMRWNPNATSTSEPLPPSQTSPNADPRQLSLYGAAWTLGSFKYLSESEVNAITYFQTCGWTGLLPHVSEPWPEDYDVPKNGVYPLYLILKEILRHKQNFIVPIVSSDPLVVDGIAFEDSDSRITVILANYTNEEKIIELPSEFKPLKVRIIDVDNIETLTQNLDLSLNQISSPSIKRIHLKPFSIIVLEYF